MYIVEEVHSRFWDESFKIIFAFLFSFVMSIVLYNVQINAEDTITQKKESPI